MIFSECRKGRFTTGKPRFPGKKPDFPHIFHENPDFAPAGATTACCLARYFTVIVLLDIMKGSSFIVWVLSFILALAATSLWFPRINEIHGGARKMFAVLFFTVLFRATVEFLLGKCRRKKNGSRSICS